MPLEVEGGRGGFSDFVLPGQSLCTGGHCPGVSGPLEGRPFGGTTGMRIPIQGGYTDHTESSVSPVGALAMIDIH